ncbi:MAG: enoyl-CoA hydratase/isomerase family protein [Acidobacteria bacterium]|nr:enoyl-CoA hydratase/isomerase family protein [Acidobacteriota bacterium]
MNYKTILVEDNPPIRTITLNRPDRRNAMTSEMQAELIEVLEETARSEWRVLILTGAGEAFCSGLELSELQAMSNKTAADHRTDAERIARLFLSLYELPIPTIAAVHGPAIAGGTGLAMTSDFTLATPSSKFGFTEVRIGFVPALVSAFLSLQVGEKRSRDLLLTGRLFDAAEAHQIGLVNEVVSHSELMTRAQTLAETLLANSPQALSATKQLLAAQNRAWLDAAIVAALEANAASRETADFREGVSAFLEKRKPSWKKSPAS